MEVQCFLFPRSPKRQRWYTKKRVARVKVRIQITLNLSVCRQCLRDYRNYMTLSRVGVIYQPRLQSSPLSIVAREDCGETQPDIKSESHDPRKTDTICGDISNPACRHHASSYLWLVSSFGTGTVHRSGVDRYPYLWDLIRE